MNARLYNILPESQVRVFEILLHRLCAKYDDEAELSEFVDSLVTQHKEMRRKITAECKEVADWIKALCKHPTMVKAMNSKKEDDDGGTVGDIIDFVKSCVDTIYTEVYE